jgi:alkaline phosphatase
MYVNRRSFFSRSGLVLAGATCAPALVRATEDVSFRPSDRPRHIIHLVADGMSQGTLSCAEHLAQLARERGLEWLRLYSDPNTVTGLMNVRSLNSLVTDSAASSSAWGSGSRVVNGAINMLPDGRKLRPLYELLRDAGWKRGLVTTTEITHATPAGFCVNVPKRSQAEVIASQMLESRIEVLLGGGARFFAPQSRSDKRDLLGEFCLAGYQVVHDRRELAAAPKGKPWLGLFSPSHLPFALDHQADDDLKATVPTLAELTKAALRKLEREEHFILQVEGGRIDHAAHLNDAGGAFHDQIAFDDALRVCLEFRQEHPSTLLVITTDHGTGNPGLNGTGTRYSKSSPLFQQLTKITHSHEWMLRRIYGVPESDTEDMLEADPSKAGLVEPAQIAEIIRAATSFRVSESQATKLHQFFAGKGDALYELANSGEFQLAQFLANQTGIGWTSLAHTSDFVPIVARGPGAERFQGFIQNVDVFRHYTQLAGVDHQNPTLPLQATSSLEALPAQSGCAHV